MIPNKVCIQCKKEKPHTNEFFHTDTSMKDNLFSCCKVCANNRSAMYRQKNKDGISEYNKQYHKNNKEKNNVSALSYKLKRQYGIDFDDYNAMLFKQNHRCCICNSHEDDFKRRLAVDHCHTTGKVRGLLCHHCNISLGNFKDDPKLLKRAIKYLEKHNGTIYEIQKGAPKGKEETTVPRHHVCISS